jgi:hypothetical protein
MNEIDIAKTRLISQKVGNKSFNTSKEVVSWMGAMQAQDFGMSKWAIGVRLSASKEENINQSINSGEILRTHLLRPTWHFVSNDDIYWMLALTAPKIKARFKSRHIDLGITTEIIRKSNRIIEKALRDGKNLTREEIITDLAKAKIDTGQNRASHLFAWAELEGLICSGAIKCGKPTFGLLEERVPNKKSLPKEEALATLACKYFSSRSPATLQDFIWWSGLSVRDAKLGLDAVATDFQPESIDSKLYWFRDTSSNPKVDTEAVYLLPAFDEFILSYKDRSASLPFKTRKKAISENGIFRPIIVVNGQVCGIWKRTIKKDKVFVETDFFDKPSNTTLDQIKELFHLYGDFIGKEIGFSSI